MNETRQNLPVTRVTVFEDRAELCREVTLTLGGGTLTLRAPDVSPLMSDAHLHARVVSGEATVQQARIERRHVAAAPAEEQHVRLLRERLRACEEEARNAHEKLARAQQEREGLPGLLGRFAEQLGRAHWEKAAELGGLVDALPDVRQRLVAADAAVAAALDGKTQADLALEELHGLLRDAEARPARLVADLVVGLTGHGPVKLSVTALVPCALWRPSHQAGLEGAQVTWTTFATVWQRTGEAWKDVELVLSTARPSAGAQLPGLQEDRLQLRQKTAEERKTVVVEHRQESISREALKGGAPGVYDGGIARTFQPPGKVSIPDDGRPHRVSVGGFAAPAATELVTMPEYATRVYLRASLRNLAQHPLLAGPVTLLNAGGYVGTGDLPYVGAGEAFDVSLGSDDRFVVRHVRRREEQEKLLGKDVTHFVTDVEVKHTGAGLHTVVVMLRQPVSEVAQLKVLPSPKHATENLPGPDAQGLLRIPLELAAGQRKKVSVAFHFETSGDVRVPDPW